jgi:hypothetical protein
MAAKNNRPNINKNCIHCGKGPINRSKGNVCKNNHYVCIDCLYQYASDEGTKISQEGNIECSLQCEDIVPLSIMFKLFSVEQYKTISLKLTEIQKQLLLPTLKQEVVKVYEKQYEEAKHRLENPSLETECDICGDELFKDTGLRCDQNCSFCSDCLQQCIQSMENLQMTTEGYINCPGHKCLSKLSYGKLDLILSQDGRKALNDKFKAVNEQQLIPELEKSIKQQSSQPAVDMHIKNIIDNCITLKCPRCQQAFIDFDGCFALTCSNKTCNCAFCAYCLEDCGRDAHRHVANCELNRSKNVFNTQQVFKEVQKKRQKELINNYLKMLPVAEKKHIIIHLKKFNVII